MLSSLPPQVWSALVAGAFAIIGGALGYWFSSLRDTKTSRRERLAKLRERQMEALIDFVHASNDVNRHRQGLNFIVHEIGLSRGGRTIHYEQELEERRQQAFRDIAEAQTRAETAELNIRLLAPFLTTLVKAVSQASYPLKYETAKEDHEKRENALAMLFQWARETLELNEDQLK